MKSPELRASFEAAMVAEIDDFGSEGVRRAEIVRLFQSRGVDRSTLFRWIDKRIEAERSAKRVRRLGRRSATRRRLKAAAEIGGGEVGGGAAGSEPEGLAGVAATVPASVPARRSITLLIFPILGLRLVDRMTEAVVQIEAVMRHAQTEDGRVRNPKLLLEACRLLPKALEAKNKLVPMMREFEKVGSYFTEMMEMIACFSPEAAEAAMVRVEALALRWNKMPE